MEEKSWRINHGPEIMEEQSWMRNHGGVIKEEKSWRRSHGGEIRGDTMEEKASTRNNGGEIMEKKSWRRNPPEVFPPSLKKHNYKLNIEYDQFVCQGTHEAFPKCLQITRTQHPKLTENQCPGLHFYVLWGVGVSPGAPWRPCWDGNLKKYEKQKYRLAMFF